MITIKDVIERSESELEEIIVDLFNSGEERRFPLGILMELEGELQSNEEKARLFQACQKANWKLGYGTFTSE